MQFVWSSSKAYLGYRAFTSVSSLAFAFLYSRSLGVENRSVIAFVMTANALTWIVVTSGTTLTLRKLRPSAFDVNALRSFFSLYLLEVLFSWILFAALIFTYSSFKNDVPLNLLLGIFVYFLLSGLHLISVELLLAFDQFKTSGLLDIASITFQVTFFLILNHLNLMSIANTLLIAFSASYLIVFLVALSYLRYKLNLKIGLSRPQYFFALTKGHHSLGISIGIMDRIDRLLIGFFLPTSTLGRYAVMSGMLSVFRFVPDSISKLLVSRNISLLSVLREKRIRVGILFVCFVVVLSIVSNIVIELVLGKVWLLPINVTVFFIFQEFFRSAFQIQANRCIVQGFTESVHRQAISIPIISVILTLCLVPFLGVYGVSLAISVAFISALLILGKI